MSNTATPHILGKVTALLIGNGPLDRTTLAYQTAVANAAPTESWRNPTERAIAMGRLHQAIDALENNGHIVKRADLTYVPAGDAAQHACLNP